MILQLFYPYMKFTLGTLYPAYKTWKSLKRKDDTARRRWMKYWVSFGAFQMFELIADITLAFILPFYIELKLATMLWLVLGTKLIFDSIVNRELTKREKSIDRLLNKGTKIRDELIAIIWYEISRCSMKIITGLMSGGLSVLVSKTPEQSNHASPICSEDEVDAVADVKVEPEIETVIDYEPLQAPPQLKAIKAPRLRRPRRQLQQVQQLQVHQKPQEQEEPPVLQMRDKSNDEETVHYMEPDFNENTVSMDWSTNDRRCFV